jgi:NAD(P)H-flavin reductase
MKLTIDILNYLIKVRPKEKVTLIFDEDKDGTKISIRMPLTKLKELHDIDNSVLDGMTIDQLNIEI